MRDSPPSSVRPLPRAGREAVVLGASMAGLLATAVLAEAYDRVVLVERDELLGDGEPRRGVPQGRHAHLLLPRGADALEALFPGFLAQIAADGAVRSTRLDQAHLEFNGHPIPQDDTEDNPSYEQSRPFLEAHVLERVRSLPNVRILENHDVLGLRADHRQNVIGATVVPRGGDAEVDLSSDLVVAATGRSGRVGAWLTELGYDPPREEEVRVDIMYASRRMRLDRELTGGLDVMFVGSTAERPTGLGGFIQEGGSWILTLFGFGGHHPPTEPGDWLASACALAPPQFARAIRSAEPEGGIHTHRFPSNLRRRYEKVTGFPEGLIVIGDAVCSFNPIYGQGMTVAALEALALRETLSRGTRDLAHRFFKAAARPVNNAWQFAVGSDLALPPSIVPGARPLPMRVVNAYVDRYQAAAEHDSALAVHFLRVTGFEEPVTALFTPRALAKVVSQRRRRSREDAPLPLVSS